MAKNASDDITYFVVVHQEHLASLAEIRQWDNLKVGIEGQMIWVKDFTYAQIHAVAVKKIPYKTIYYAKLNKLFPLNSNLPEGNTPSLLWTPIQRALPVKLPSYNHNYFGVHEKISVSLIPSQNEADATAMLVPLSRLEQYIITAPSIRLENLRWIILGEHALLFGTPFLPLTGISFWQRNDFLIPTGYDIDLHLVTGILQTMIDPGNEHWVLWHTDGHYTRLPKRDVCELSLSSFRASLVSLKSFPS